MAVPNKILSPFCLRFSHAPLCCPTISNTNKTIIPYLQPLKSLITAPAELLLLSHLFSNAPTLSFTIAFLSLTIIVSPSYTLNSNPLLFSLFQNRSRTLFVCDSHTLYSFVRPSITPTVYVTRFLIHNTSRTLITLSLCL